MALRHDAGVPVGSASSRSLSWCSLGRDCRHRHGRRAGGLIEPYWAGLAVAASGLLALVAGLLRQRGAMTTIRAGAWPALGCGDQRPPHANIGAVAALSRGLALLSSAAAGRRG